MKKRAFSLVEVIMAASIVAIAVVSCYEVIFMVRALNMRAAYYGMVLPFVRQKMTNVLSSHVVPVKTESGTIPKPMTGSPTVDYKLTRKSISKTVDKVILKIKAKNESLQELTFETYVTSAVKR